MYSLFEAFCCQKEKSKSDHDDQNIGLLDMPDLVMRETLANCDLMSILRLTKVCRALYHFISRSPQSTKVNSLRVSVREDEVHVYMYYFKPYYETILIRFHYNENGCFVVRNQVERFLRNEDFVSIACMNLNFCIRYIGTLLRFEIDQYQSDGFPSDFKASRWNRLQSAFCGFKRSPLPLPSQDEITNRVVDTIESCLQFRRRPIKVSTLTMSLKEPYPNFLNLIDPKSLDHLSIWKFQKFPEFDARRLINLWTLRLSATFSNPIQDFFHIKNVYLTVESISKEEVLEIKEARYSASSHHRTSFSAFYDSFYYSTYTNNHNVRKF
uniref:F-box domain-containing protein n=1 Tax=Caenorhabditis tropicalis TaxID=1561998 RepID=A0A1I7UTG6_9PELO